VLAVHRAGAAAIDTLRNGMVSEAGLVDVLSSCRALVAGQVVDSVAKSLEPSYAGLLVSDVFDDAEQGAVSLYRTAVNKGVAPSVAVVRVSDVFGVPASLMGRYQLVATDPKTSPAASRDLADRTLLEYVAKLVEAESLPGLQGGHDRRLGRVRGQPRRGGPVRPGEHPARVGTLEYTREQLGLTGTPGRGRRHDHDSRSLADHVRPGRRDRPGRPATRAAPGPPWPRPG
jgi:hypothetical protein